jgi:hypothetical protein
VEPVIEITAEPVEEIIEADENGEDQAAGEAGVTEAASSAEVSTGWEPDFVDTRDDRVVLYAGLSRDVATYEYKVRATNAGVYRTPPPYAEGMYERGLQGRGESGTLTIVEP